MRVNIRFAAGAAVLGVFLASSACNKKNVAVAPPPQTPSGPDSTPVVTAAPKDGVQLAQPPRIESFTAEPPSVERNQGATLRWVVAGTSPEIVLDPSLGIVTPTGNRQVFPMTTTTYTLTARSAVGMDSRSVTIEVRNPPAPPKGPSGAPLTSGEAIRTQAKDVYFDYDRAELREDAREALEANADLLRRIFANDPNFIVVIEGHADERGSAEYNIGLGDRRATITREFLIQLGVPGNRLRTLSLGEERPACTIENEVCYQRNRRAHLEPGQ